MSRGRQLHQFMPCRRLNQLFTIFEVNVRGFFWLALMAVEVRGWGTGRKNYLNSAYRNFFFVPANQKIADINRKPKTSMQMVSGRFCHYFLIGLIL